MTDVNAEQSMADITGIILAAGKGSRMQPFSDICPKSVVSDRLWSPLRSNSDMRWNFSVKRYLIS